MRCTVIHRTAFLPAHETSPLGLRRSVDLIDAPEQRRATQTGTTLATYRNGLAIRLSAVANRGRNLMQGGTFPFGSDFILGEPRSLTHVAGGLHSPKIRASGLRFAQKAGSCLFVIRPMPRSCIAPTNGSSVQSGQCAHPDSEDSAAPQFRRFCGEAEHMRGERHVQRRPVQCLRQVLRGS